MLSSYRSHRAMGRGRGTCPCVLSLALLAGTSASAAEYYSQPLVTLSAEHHTNVDLEVDTGLPEHVMGYIAVLQDILGILTPTSDTQFRPRLILQRYSDRSDLSRTDEFFDGKTLIQSQRSVLELFGAASRQDSYTAETINPQFDEFNPRAPATAQSGRIDVGNWRTNVDLRPRYTYELSQRTDVGVSGEYTMANFQSQIPGSEVSFDYGLANVFIVKKLSPKTNIETGIYASDFKTKNDTYKDDAYGLSFDINHEWTRLFTGSLTLQAERDDLRELIVGSTGREVASFSGTNFGAFLSLQYKAQVSQLRLTAGRQLVPSSAGTVEGVDQIRVQYDRHWSPRLTVTEAVIVERQRAISNIGAVNSVNDHDDVAAVLKAQWALTRTFFVEGEYRYTRLKYVTDSGPATDQQVGITFGYRGIGPQR
jgi:hypothetical protein